MCIAFYELSVAKEERAHCLSSGFVLVEFPKSCMHGRPTYWTGVARVADPSKSIVVTLKEIVTMRSWQAIACLTLGAKLSV